MGVRARWSGVGTNRMHHSERETTGATVFEHTTERSCSASRSARRRRKRHDVTERVSPKASLPPMPSIAFHPVPNVCDSAVDNREWP